jgi:hypothetical protein
MHLVDCSLNNDMRARFQSKWARLIFQLGTGERPLNVSRACVVTFDQVRVVAVYHTDEVRKFRRTVRVQPLSHLRRFFLDIDRKISQFSGNVLLKEARFDSAGCFQHFCRSFPPEIPFKYRPNHKESEGSCRYGLPIMSAGVWTGRYDQMMRE